MKGFRLSILLLAVKAVFVVPASAAVGTPSGYQWPLVSPLDGSFDFTHARADDWKVDLNILSSDGKPLYRLLCHVGGYEGPDLPGPLENFSGTFDCHLYPLQSKNEHYVSLLLSDPIYENTYGRSRMLADEITGKCASYSEYGDVRTFRLRGMQITFRYSDVVDSASGDQSFGFKFSLDVRPDALARSSLPEPVEVAEPQRTREGKLICDQVIRRHVPGIVNEQYIEGEGLAPPFPRVLGMKRTSMMTPENDDIFVVIRGEKGQRLYDFRCLNQGRWGIHCGLFFPGGNLNLLADGVDPYSSLSPAIVFLEQLHGECAHYPEWGTMREFRLRGMRLRLEFKNPEFSSGRQPPVPRINIVSRVALTVLVESEPTATSPVAASPRYIYWGALPLQNACRIPLLIAPDGS